MPESGYPGHDLEIWFALYAPSRTPPEIVPRLGDAMRQWLATPQAREAFAAIGHQPAPSTSDEVRERMASERKSFAPAVKAAGLKPD